MCLKGFFLKQLIFYNLNTLILKTKKYIKIIHFKKSLRTCSLGPPKPQSRRGPFLGRGAHALNLHLGKGTSIYSPA